MRQQSDSFMTYTDRKSRSEKKKSENNMLFLAAVACVATAQTMWKRQTHAQEK